MAQSRNPLYSEHLIVDFFMRKWPSKISDKIPNTVVTPNKGQSIFGKIGSNKGISLVPLFVIFDKWYEIRDFSVEIRQK